MIATIGFIVHIYLIAWVASTILALMTGLMLTVIDSRMVMSAFTVFLIVAGWLWIVGFMAVIIAFVICLVMRMLKLVQVIAMNNVMIPLIITHVSTWLSLFVGAVLISDDHYEDTQDHVLGVALIIVSLTGFMALFFLELVLFGGNV